MKKSKQKSKVSGGSGITSISHRGRGGSGNSSKLRGKIQICALCSLIFVIMMYVYGFIDLMNRLPSKNVEGGSSPLAPGKAFSLSRSMRGFKRIFPHQQQNLQKNELPHFDTPPKKTGVPKAVWPVPPLVDGENNEIFETIVHPVYSDTLMKVPKLWSLPIHHNKLMDRELALSVGTCIEPDANGNYARGDSCPVDKRTIYVAVASYRDYQCRYTVESIFSRAKYPERLRVGIVDQIVHGEDAICNEPIEPCENNPGQALCMYKDQIVNYEMEAKLGVGPVFARHIGHRIYRGEYYTTQSDAHVTYTQNWDVDIILQLEATNNELAVLSTYLTDIQGSIDEKTGLSLRKTRPIMCNTRYEGGSGGTHLRHGSQPESQPAIHGTPMLQPWWAAGYSFSRGHFIVNVPYDPYQPLIFQGEEMSIGLRGFTIGYDFYAPERSVCFHHYATGANAEKRNKVKKFWENSNNIPGFQQIERKAMSRLLGIVHMIPEVDVTTWDHTEESIYGIGDVRSPERFFEIFGIDVVNKKVQNHLCKFVGNGGKMHKMFSKYLRNDGMGIDYTNIQYKFVDPTPDEPVHK